VRRYGLIAAILAVGALLGWGCGGQHARGSEDPKLDEMTMSLRLDRKDLERLYRENYESLMNSEIAGQWKKEAKRGDPPVVACFPLRNETSEHIRGSLDSLLSKFQTELVNNSPVDVVARDRQEELIEEVERQQAAAYDPERLSEYAQQLGAQYFVTGRVYDVAERTEGKRRVQYFLYFQVLNVETGAITFQTEAKVSKALL